MKHLLLLISILFTLNAQKVDIDDVELKKMIGRMLVIGFPQQSVDKDSQIVKDIKEYNLGGIILFDKFYNDRSKTKNISSPNQLKKLTQDLKEFSAKPLIISIDQEGGKVSRLKPKYGFNPIPSALAVSKLSIQEAKGVYKAQSKMIKEHGINTNFAPVLDLSLNQNNRVIVGLERSFGEKSKNVLKYAKIVMDEQKDKNIISVLKHFPGHGSSLGDSHEGFVDITETWSEKELTPYKKLIANKSADMIMTAHVFNKHLDKKHPATLSHNVNTKLLRQKMLFRGVVISDDLQMKAISKHYSLRETTTLAINSGVDILLFGNQLEEYETKDIISTIFEEVKNGNIPIDRIIESNVRIKNLHTKNSIIQKPIIFKEKRISLSKEYINQHYKLKVENIEIIPKTIVLHWTAVMDFNDSFERLNGELLYSDRKDIVKASALNVSSHFLIKRDGTIYQLMPENWMARHVIGLNYSSIGVENVGGESNKKEDLTEAQLQANIDLVNYLKSKYPSIKNVIGHHEYRQFEKTPLWLEVDDGYRTEKADPGDMFMRRVREAINE